MLAQTWWRHPWLYPQSGSWLVAAIISVILSVLAGCPGPYHVPSGNAGSIFADDSGSHSIAGFFLRRRRRTRPAVPNQTDSVVLAAVPADAMASVSVPVALNPGDNTLTMRVTAEDGTSRTYTIRVNRMVAGLQVFMRNPCPAAAWQTVFLYYTDCDSGPECAPWPGNRRRLRQLPRRPVLDRLDPRRHRSAEVAVPELTEWTP